MKRDASHVDVAVREAAPPPDTGGDGHSPADSAVDAPAPRDAGVDAMGGCAAGSTESCTASCGTTGTATCAGGAFGACVPPAEVCNLLDDDCNGACDDVLGCRVGVDRSDDASSGLHFYTTTDSEASCCGFTVETFDYYYLYAAAQPGLVPFYRCSTAAGSHLYTTDSGCEGNTLEGSMGFIATSADVCGSVPLFRLDDASSGDHFYTTSQAEASAATAGGGYVANGIAGYVWPGDCGGSGCTWPSPIVMNGSTTTAATGFPPCGTAFRFPAARAPRPSRGACPSPTPQISTARFSSSSSICLRRPVPVPPGSCRRRLPSMAPPGRSHSRSSSSKRPPAGPSPFPSTTHSPVGFPISDCVLLGLNGGTVAASHDVTAAASLSLAFTQPVSPAQSLALTGGEFCFGMNGGCQGSTTDDTQSFATVTPITTAAQVVALYGDISDSTFDGTASFGPLPTGAWTATNDFYVYHGSECGAFGVSSGIAGPGDFYASIPGDATPLASVPLSGNGIGVAESQVFQALSVPVAAGDCFVTLWGLSGNGAFDNETQVFTLLAP